MAMQPRERMLALALGLVVGLIFVYWAYGQYTEMFSRRERDLASVETAVSKKDAQVRRIEKAIDRRRELEKRSLPTNKTEAGNRYHDWLLSLISGKLGEPSVTPRQATIRAKGYEPLDFEVKGEGTLEQVTKFLHDFYSANHLHQVTSLIIKPQDKTGKLTLTMQVEAIILPGATRKDTLTTEPGDNLALDNYSDYQKAIVGRNLFAEYKPPAPPPTVARATEPTFDLAKLAYLTNIGHGTDGRYFAWIHERSTNKLTKLFVGDEFQIAGLKGKVQNIDIDAPHIELLIDDKPVVFSQYKSLGETLADRQKMQK
jgi:hypothetical protein